MQSFDCLVIVYSDPAVFALQVGQLDVVVRCRLIYFHDFHRFVEKGGKDELGFILIGGALVCLLILLFKMPEGPAQTFEIAAMDNKFYLGDLSLDMSTSTFWVCLIYGIFTNLQNYGIDQNYVQRYHTAKSERQAKFSALFGGYLFIPVSAIFFLIGTALYAYYKVYPELLPAEGLKADYVFPFFIVNELPVGMTGLLIRSILAETFVIVSKYNGR